MERKLYTIDDVIMHTIADVLCSLLSDDLTLFTAVFPFVNINYVNDMNQDIINVRAYSLDVQKKGAIGIIAEQSRKLLVTCYDALTLLNKYALIAHKNNPEKQKVAGKETWQKAKVNPLVMSAALEKAHEYAKNDPVKTALFAVGYTQAALDNLMVLSAQASSIHIKLGMAKKDRKESTVERRRLNNLVYARMQDVNLYASTIFRGDPARMKVYGLSPKREKVVTTIKVQVIADCQNCGLKTAS